MIIFYLDGSVALNSVFAQSAHIKILQDTGASQSLILADTLPFSEKTFFYDKCPNPGYRV